MRIHRDTTDTARPDRALARDLRTRRRARLRLALPLAALVAIVAVASLGTGPLLAV